jgi:hypothetical protein
MVPEVTHNCCGPTKQCGVTVALLRLNVQPGLMTQRTVVTLEDDLTGGEAHETVSFALDGKAYEIDLSDKNAAALRETLAPFIGSARRAGRINVPAARRGAPLRHVATDLDPAAVRAWAASNGHEVSPRGRISRAIQDAFKAAMG